jgi:hypothetical protein
MKDTNVPVGRITFANGKEIYPPMKSVTVERPDWEKRFDSKYHTYVDTWNVPSVGYGVTARKMKNFIRKAIKEELEKANYNHYKRVNKILNSHSHPLLDGGLDAEACFREFEKYEKELAKTL